MGWTGMICSRGTSGQGSHSASMPGGVRGREGTFCLDGEYSTIFHALRGGAFGKPLNHRGDKAHLLLRGRVCSQEVGPGGCGLEG